MKKPLLVLLAFATWLSCGQPAQAQGTASPASNELKALVTKVQDKLHEGKKTEADLAPELKEFDALIDKYKDQKTDDTAQIILMKAMLYLEVFDNSDKGVALVQQLKKDYS